MSLVGVGDQQVRGVENHRWARLGAEVELEQKGLPSSRDFCRG